MRRRTGECPLYVFDLLAADHQVLAELMNTIGQLWDRYAFDDVADYFSVFSQSSAVHAEAEERAIFTVLDDGPPELEALVRDAEHHHALARTHIEELGHMDVSAPEWRPRYAALVELIQYIIALEDGSIRDIAALELTPKLSAQLARDYLTIKDEAAKAHAGVATAHAQFTPAG